MDPMSAIMLASAGIKLVRDLVGTARAKTSDPATAAILDGILSRVEGARELAESALDAADRRDEATLKKIAEALGE